MFYPSTLCNFDGWRISDSFRGFLNPWTRNSLDKATSTVDCIELSSEFIESHQIDPAVTCAGINVFTEARDSFQFYGLVDQPYSCENSV